MSEEFGFLIDTNEKLRSLLKYITETNDAENRAHIPSKIVWGLLPPGAKDGMVPIELGGERVPMNQKYYITTVDNKDYMLIGRTSSTDNVPTGNFQEITPKEFWSAVDLIGIDNTYIKLPEPSNIEI